MALRWTRETGATSTTVPLNTDMLHQSVVQLAGYGLNHMVFARTSPSKRGVQFSLGSTA